jgi:hypothetical protein
MGKLVAAGKAADLGSPLPLQPAQQRAQLLAADPSSSDIENRLVSRAVHRMTRNRHHLLATTLPEFGHSPPRTSWRKELEGISLLDPIVARQCRWNYGDTDPRTPQPNRAICVESFTAQL